MSPRLPPNELRLLFWQSDGAGGDGGGDAGASSGVGGSAGFGAGGEASGVGTGIGGPGSAGEAASVGGSTTGGFGGDTGGDTGSVSAGPGDASQGFGGISGFSVAGVNAPGPTGGGSSAGPAAGLGQAGGIGTSGVAPGVGGGVSGPSFGGHGGIATNLSQLFGGAQGTNPATAAGIRGASLLGLGPGGVLGGLANAAPVSPVSVQPILPGDQATALRAALAHLGPSPTTSQLASLLANLRGIAAASNVGTGAVTGSGGQGQVVGDPGARGSSAVGSASAPSIAASPAPSPATPPAPNLGLGPPAAIGNTVASPSLPGTTTTPPNPMAPNLGSANPSLASLASMFAGGGNKAPPGSTGLAGGNFGASPWLMGGVG